jgi:hypothetical protein
MITKNPYLCKLLCLGDQLVGFFGEVLLGLEESAGHGDETGVLPEIGSENHKSGVFIRQINLSNDGSNRVDGGRSLALSCSWSQSAKVG